MQEEIVATFRFMGIAAKILGNIYQMMCGIIHSLITINEIKS